MKRRKLWRLVVVGLLVLLLVYFGSYVALSAGGCYEPASIGLNGVKWYAWAPHGFVEDYKWKRWPTLIYVPLLLLDYWLWHPSGNPPPKQYPIDEVRREDIWKVYKAYGFFDQKDSSETQSEEPK
jgi:hypothetical protein